jgi:hypothetical protein
MWISVKRPDGRIKEIEVPSDAYIGIGDVLEDGSVVEDVPYPDDIDEDLIAIDEY